MTNYGYLRAYLKKAPFNDTLAKKYIDNGVFNGISDFTKIENVSAAYNRLLEISRCYAHEGSFYYDSVDVLYLVIKSLVELSKYYNKKTKKNGNWWYYNIGIPYSYGCILALCNLVTDENYGGVIEKFVRKKIKYGDLTYANLASACRNLLIGGLVLNNEKYVNEALKYAVPAFTKKSICQIKFARALQRFYIRFPKLPNEVSFFAGKEGLYEDSTFIQHTSIPYIGTYGTEMLEYAALVVQTHLTLNSEINNELPDWIYAFRKAIYNKEMMLMYCGRAVKEVNLKGVADRIKNYIDEIKEVISINEKEIPVLWYEVQPNSDKAFLKTIDFLFAVSMCSDRTAKYESFNGQNQDGWYQNLGMTYVYIPKTTFTNYLNKVSPYYLPGVTCTNEERKVVESKHPIFNFTKDDLEHSIAGGCSDFEYEMCCATAMMEVCDNGLTAKKSWFMFDDRILCLGSDINKPNAHTTLVNLVGITDYEVNDKIIYIPKFGSVAYRINSDYIEYNTDNGNLCISIKHDKCSTYQYIIAPLQKLTYNDYFNDLDVLEQSSTVHAIIHNNKILANFWKEGALHFGEGQTVTSDNITSLMVKVNDDLTLDCYVSDVTQRLDKITLTFNGIYRKVESGEFDKLISVKEHQGKEDYTKVTIKCKDLLGKTVYFKLKRP